MNRQCMLAAAAIVALVVGSAGAQRRPYDAIMKEVGPTFDALRQALEDPDLPLAAADAEKLERLFAEVEHFWTPFRTKDAIDSARGARDTLAAVAAAARNKDAEKARAAAAGLGAFCATCHGSHRELQPDRTYRIKP